MFQIDNYINAPLACVAITVIAAVFTFGLVIYNDARAERERRRRNQEAQQTGRAIIIDNDD